ncbi:MAG: hypothetical protein MR508_09875 [Lachnospiraceae bacterium]|nr:hypothetical protein [Lachnospiraceae bacterium]
MNKLKQRITSGLLMAMMLVVSVFGNATTANAATLTADQYLAKMAKVNAKTKSVEMSQSTTVNMTMNGQTISSKASGSGIIFFNSGKAKYVQKITVKAADQKETQTTRMYVKKSGGKLYLYTSEDGKTYQKEKLGDMADFTSQLGKVDTSAYSNAKIVKKSVKVGKVDTVQISCSITGEDMQNAVNQAGVDVSALYEMGLDFSTMKPIKVTYLIDKKTYRPVKCSVDLTAFMNDLFATLMNGFADNDEAAAEIGSLEFTCTTAKSTVSYKNYNKAKNFSYPKAVK